jgi:hypothetical protein
MQISGVGFNPYSSMTRIQKPPVTQGPSNIQAVQQQSLSAIDRDGDGDSDSGKGVDNDPTRGRNIDIRA